MTIMEGMDFEKMKEFFEKAGFQVMPSPLLAPSTVTDNAPTTSTPSPDGMWLLAEAAAGPIIVTLGLLS